MQFLIYVLYILLALTSFFLICLILIQRGKGGGLAGAFGGVGGSSAFGTKAGDIFTRVTMITAGIWITLNMLLVVITNKRPSAFGENPPAPASSGTTPGTSKINIDPADLDKPKGKTAGDTGTIEPATGKTTVPPASGTSTVPDAGPLAPRSADLPGTPVPVQPTTGTTPPPTTKP